MGRPLELMEVASDKQNNPSSLQPSFFAITTGCSTVHVSTLIVHISYIPQPITKPFDSMKVKTGRICLVYETPCKVSFYSFYDFPEFLELFSVLFPRLPAR